MCVHIYFHGGLVVKNPSANTRAMGLIPGLGKSHGEGMATHSSILDWENPWTGEPGRPQIEVTKTYYGHKGVTKLLNDLVTKQLQHIYTYVCIYIYTYIC